MTAAANKSKHTAPPPATTLADLSPDPHNARKHNPRNIGQVQSSLQKYGAARSIVIDENNQIIAGHGVVEAAGLAGIERVQVVDGDGETIIAVRRTGLTVKQKQELGIADNRGAELAEWDADVLSALAGEVDLTQFWNKDELADILSGLGGSGADDPGADVDRAAELQAKWGTALGQLWQVGRHRLLVGDCTVAENVARLMGGEKAGAVVTDPPYGQDQVDVPGDSPADHERLMREAVANFPVDNGIVIAFQSPRMFPNWLKAIEGHKFLRALWLYKEAQMANPWRGWILKSEMILMSEIGKGEWLDTHPFAHDCYKVSEVSFRTEQIAAVRTHGSVKPLVVVQDLVSRVAGIVYEPFCGSGTTLVACEKLGRIGRGMELSPAYAAVTLERLSGMSLTPERVG